MVADYPGAALVDRVVSEHLLRLRREAVGDLHEQVEPAPEAVDRRAPVADPARDNQGGGPCRLVQRTLEEGAPLYPPVRLIGDVIVLRPQSSHQSPPADHRGRPGLEAQPSRYFHHN